MKRVQPQLFVLCIFAIRIPRNEQWGYYSQYGIKSAYCFAFINKRTRFDW